MDMERHDVIVVGAGISGLAFAWKAAQAGRKVLVLEREGRVGGCIHSVHRADGYWYELGAHTVYNSYGAFLDIAVGTGVTREIVERGPARAHFGLVRDGQYKWLTPPKILLQLNWLEAAVSAPFGFFRSKEGQTIKSYYGGLVGRRNYERLFGPFLAAVPSQSADGFPVEGPGSLFKKRPRREEFIRSFGFKGGLGALCDAAAKAEGVTVETGVTVRKVARAAAGYAVTTADGRTLEAEVVAVAAPADAAAAMLGEVLPEVRRQIERVKTVTVESHGVVLPRDKCWMPEVAFVIPADDVFHSAVTRDPFPDPRFRAFAFHFKAGLTREDRIRRMSEVLRLPPEELGEITDQRLVLPAPALGHGDIVKGLDAALAGGRLALTGNYFAGLAIEDCVLRSNDEWRRVNV
jgi:protoporphyrinogen/coproporphyrinogen III oxidase